MSLENTSTVDDVLIRVRNAVPVSPFDLPVPFPIALDSFSQQGSSPGSTPLRPAVWQNFAVNPEVKLFPLGDSNRSTASKQAKRVPLRQKPDIKSKMVEEFVADLTDPYCPTVTQQRTLMHTDAH